MNGIQIATVILMCVTIVLTFFTIYFNIQTSRTLKRNEKLRRLQRAGLRIDDGKVVRIKERTDA